jgi:hypothetical protein
MIDKKCEGCKKVVAVPSPYQDFIHCEVYAFPPAKWRLGTCPMATHVEKAVESQQKVRVGQQKQKKAK